MLRLNKNIRLTAEELKRHRDFVGVGPVPKTVEELNGQLDNAAEGWKNSEDSAEAKLLATMTESLKVPE